MDVIIKPRGAAATHDNYEILANTTTISTCCGYEAEKTA